MNSVHSTLRRVSGLAFVLAGGFAAAPASATVITVGQPGDPNCDYHVPQAAIAAAAASPGLDIVRVAIGVFQPSAWR